ncbi:MAG: MarR family winged helix-turn-helix transcriptional regulator [Candidatus Undinarchaeales archaeon]
MANSIKSTDIEGLFFQKMPARLLVSIKRKEDPYTNSLAKHIDCTYAHASKLVKKMERMGLIETEKDGRTKYIELTEEGHKLANHIENLLTLKDI